MLQRMQAQVGERLRLGVRVDRNHPALITKFVRLQHSALSHQPSVKPPRDPCHPEGLQPRRTYALQSAATAGSLRNARSSDPSYPSRNSEIEADITTRPSTLISKFPETVSPNDSAKMPAFPATSLIRATSVGSHEITIRLASSPNSTNSGESPWELTFTEHPISFANEDSANATASPPSEDRKS